MNKTFRFLVLFSAGLFLLLSPRPSFAVSKEIIQLQTEVQDLQNQMTQMQQSFNQQMGVMKNLIDQSTDNVNKMSAAVDALQKSVQQQSTDTGNHINQVSGQIQALNDSVDELKARMTKLGQQIDAMQQNQQNLNAAPGAQGTQGQAPQAQAPPADILYQNALRDYNSAKYPLAAQEFADYLKFYGNTDLAGNAQFYTAEIEYRQGNYPQAVQDYDKVLEQYPGGNKTAAAELKKGFALLELGQRQAAVRELHTVENRYPNTIEANEARDRLRRLVSESTVPRKPSPSTPQE
jgi:tol-pal system protein YbgF